MITIEVDEATKKLREQLGKFNKREVNELLASALNSAITSAKRYSALEVARIYNIQSPAVVTSKLLTRRAKPALLEATISADPLGIQLRNFSPAQSTDKKRTISVEIIRGKRESFGSAFMVTARKGAGNETTSIFVRGKYSGRNLMFRRKRVVPYPNPDMPIQLIRSTSPLAMLRRDAVKARIEEKANQAFSKGVTKRIQKLLGAGNTSVD